jgi:biopolymer transport protein ExbB
MRRAISAAGASSTVRWWTRLWPMVVAACVFGIGHLMFQPAGTARLFAQAERNPELEAPALDDTALDAADPATGSPSAGDPAPRPRTIFDTIRDGGIIGLIIILISMVAVGFIVEHALTIRKERLMPEAVLQQLEDLVSHGELDAAVQVCEDPRNYSLASEVVLAGIERYRHSEFGYAEYKSAAEEAGEEFTARLYRKTDALSVIGAIAPMLGLLGTVVGMIGAFNTIAATRQAADPSALGGDIGKALITTALGLLVAIPAMLAFSFFRNKIDSIVAECSKRVERILMPLSRHR